MLADKIAEVLKESYHQDCDSTEKAEQAILDIIAKEFTRECQICDGSGYIGIGIPSAKVVECKCLKDIKHKLGAKKVGKAREGVCNSSAVR